jgi:hypothetical protein
MVPTVVPDEHPSDPSSDPGLNVDPDRVHLIVPPAELAIVVGALRSIGSVDMADRFDAVLHQLCQDSARERRA